MRELKSKTATWEAEGSRLELVFTADPNGGLLVAWPDGRWLGRALRNPAGAVRITTLAGRLLAGDQRTVQTVVTTNQDALPWG